MYEDCLLTVCPKKPLKLSLLAINQQGDPGSEWRKVLKMLPDFSSVATGSRPGRREEFGGKSYVRPRPDCRL
jgi:hypothetical protein